jgi:uncharacterized protein YciI
LVEAEATRRGFVSIDGEEYVPRSAYDELRAERDGLVQQNVRHHYFLVRETRGPSWDDSRARREQDGWDEHAAFMDELVADGFVVLGGPVGDVNTGDPLLVVDAEDEAAVRARLAEDPWADTVLTIRSIEPWTVWLRG